MEPVAELTRPSHTPQRAQASGRIAEIEGVRGLALTLVVLFHLFGDGRVSGGVDVFLLISGFLLTRSVIRKVEAPGRPFLVEHFGRVLLRLAPAALVVLVFVAVATLLLAPTTRWFQTARELLASLLYYENWELIRSQLAYGAAGPDTSPLQHFWSLSVQGQFFLVWPFALVLLAAAARTTQTRLPTWVLAATVALTLGSFTYAAYLHGSSQSVAYFSSFTRLWELTAGALLAVIAPMVIPPPRIAAAMGWLGLAMIVSCGFLIDGGSHFPGPAAMWPLLGIAMIILASSDNGAGGPARALEWSPLKFLAGISYPLYLWHWPILIFYLQWRGLSGVGLSGATVILALSIALAWVTQRFVAEPALKLTTKRPARQVLLIGASSIIVIAASIFAVVVRLDLAREEALEEAVRPSPNHPGSLVLTSNATAAPNTPWIPKTSAASADVPSVYALGCVQNWRSEPGMDAVLVCPDPLPNPRKTIVMSGGSHVLHWYPALRSIADNQGWRLIVVDKDACRMTVRGEGSDGLSESCHRWNEAALPALIDMQPDAVFTVATKTPEDPGATEIAYEGQVGAWARLAQAGIPVIAVRDTPRFFAPIPDCVAENPARTELCARDRSEIFLEPSPIRSIEGVPESTVLLDLTDGFCTETTCEPVVGNVLAYRDRDHMTATYSRTLAPHLLEQLRENAPWLF